MTAPLRLAFMGTPDFSVPCLAALIEAGHEVVCVYSQPPRPAGRGHKLRPSPVHAFAEERGIPVRTPKSLRKPEEQQAFAELGLDAAIVVAYGLILPQPILDTPRLGCINVHASLLPRWRGAAPIQRAIMSGDAQSGVVIMHMEAGLDTGPMLSRTVVPIGPTTDAGQLHDVLSEAGAKLLVPTLADLAAGKITPVPQPEEGVTYAAKITREDAAFDWKRPTVEIDRLIRSLTPYPGVTCYIRGEPVKILAARPLETKHGAVPGETLDEHLTIACGDGALRLERVQRAGKTPVEAEAFLRGFPVPAGERVETAAPASA